MIVEKINAKIEEQRNKIYPQHVNRISSIGWPCKRCLVYSIVRWKDKKKPSLELQKIFNEGRVQEEIVKRELMESGIKILWTETPVSYEEERLNGHIDGVVEDVDSKVAIEIKSMNPHLYLAINSSEDFLKHSFPIYKCYIPQIQLYMNGFNLKRGIYLLKNKSTGELKEIEVLIDKDLCNSLLQKCREINTSVDAIKKVLIETYQVKEIADFEQKQDLEDYMTIKNEACALIEYLLPERINDLKVCEYCNFDEICLPDEIRESQAKIFTASPEFIKKLMRREELNSLRKEYKVLDDEVKNFLKARNESHFFIFGDNKDESFEITVKHTKNGTRVDIAKTE